MEDNKTPDSLIKEIEELKNRLEEAEDALRAFRQGQQGADNCAVEAPSSPYDLENPYRAVVQRMTEPAATLSDEGEILFANSAFTDLLELSQEYLMGTPFRDYVSPEDKSAFDMLLLESRSGAATSEIPLLGGSGKTLPACLSLFAIRLDQARVLLLLAMDLRTRGTVDHLLQTLEKLKRFERDRIAREAQYKALLRASSQSVFRMNRDWTEMRLLTYGNFIEHSTGIKPDWIREYILPEDEPQLREAVEKALLGKTKIEREQRYLREDATIGWAHFRAVPVLNEQGDIVEWFGAGSDITERKNDEAAVRESEERLKLALEHGQMGMWEWDVRAGRSLWSPKAYELLGLPGGEGVETTESFFRRIHPADLQYVKSQLDTLLQRGSDLQNEFRIIRPDGQVRWMVARGKLLRDTGGRPLRMIGVTYDITERKHFEQALQESEAKFKKIFTDSPEAILIAAHEDCRFLDANDSFLTLVGYPREEIIGTTAQEIDIWAEPGSHEKLLRLLADQGVVKDFEALIRTRSGEILTVLLSVDIVEIANRKCLLILVKDITKRVRMEEELRSTRERLMSSLKAMTRLQTVSTLLMGIDGIHLVLEGALDAAIDITGADMGTIQLYDQATNDLKIASHRGFDQSFLDNWNALPEEQRACSKAIESRQRIAVDDMTTSPVFADCSFNLHLAAGVRAMQSTPLISRSGNILGVFCTYYKKPLSWDDRFLQLLDLLARQVTDIVEREQASEALKKAKKEAEEANRAKSLFLANMSHEIRTPMNGVLGMTQLALKNELPPNVREYLELVRQSGMSLLDIINDILDLSRIESGKAVLENEPFGLHGFIDTTIHSFKAVASEKGLGIYYCLEPNLPDKVSGDQGRLRQILTNLIGNAIKFTNKGSVRLSVSRGLEPEPPGFATLLFEITDDGVGIPKDRLGMIFDAFSQVGLSSHTKYGGTGLGLSIAKNLVELMNGRIWVESELDKGSTFSFTARFALEASGAEPSRPSPDHEARQGAGPLRILLAEDNAVNRYLAMSLLGNKGHDVVAVQNGREALERLASEPFDAVFMDVRMPEMGGEEATRRLRAGEVAGVDPRIPIIALTAHALKGDRERFLEAGMDDYMAKPLDLEELDRILGELARKKPGRQDA